MMPILYCLFFFFFNDTATTEIYTLSLHDALPILQYYKRALEVRPKDVDARTDMGICLYEMGMADDAIAQFRTRSEEHTSELQSLAYLVCRLLLEKKKKRRRTHIPCKHPM